VFFNPHGDMLIAAWHNSQIKRLHLAADLTQSTLETVAGTGARSYGGDGGPALKAAMNLPSAVVMDSKGNIMISDQANYRLRQVDPGGTITTTCGTGMQGYSGDGGPARAATLAGPKGLAYGRRILYVADTESHVIRAINLERQTIDTVLGTGVRGDGPEPDPRRCGLARPHGLFADRDGVLYVADSEAHRIRILR
jgi:sugar lactone lactonase YvrE